MIAAVAAGFVAATGTFTKPEDLPEDDWRRTNPRFQGEAFRKVITK